jgi:two-component system, OmpR family, KDP operon response regulator KdpE
MQRVMVIADQTAIRRALSRNLRAGDYDVRAIPDAIQALDEAADWQPNLVIVDLDLHDRDEVEVIKKLRNTTPAPIIVLSERAQSQDKVTALDAGADDYLSKPFSISELFARIRAVTRRGPVSDPTSVVAVGEYRVDLVNKTVNRADHSCIHLTPTEWGILEPLLRNPHKLIDRRQLLTDVWGPGTTNTNYLRIYLASLRRKLEPNPSQPRHLLTEPGMGYRFEP